MENIWKSAWELADEKEEEAKKLYLEEIMTQRKDRKSLPRHSINYDLEQYEDEEDL